jgi:hypothetical protein
MLLDALFHCREGSAGPPVKNVMEVDFIRIGKELIVSKSGIVIFLQMINIFQYFSNLKRV